LTNAVKKRGNSPVGTTLASLENKKPVAPASNDLLESLKTRLNQMNQGGSVKKTPMQRKPDIPTEEQDALTQALKKRRGPIAGDDEWDTPPMPVINKPIETTPKPIPMIPQHSNNIQPKPIPVVLPRIEEPLFTQPQQVTSQQRIVTDLNDIPPPPIHPSEQRQTQPIRPVESTIPPMRLPVDLQQQIRDHSFGWPIQETLPMRTNRPMPMSEPVINPVRMNPPVQVNEPVINPVRMNPPVHVNEPVINPVQMNSLVPDTAASPSVVEITPIIDVPRERPRLKNVVRRIIRINRITGERQVVEQPVQVPVETERNTVEGNARFKNVVRKVIRVNRRTGERQVVEVPQQVPIVQKNRYVLVNRRTGERQVVGDPRELSQRNIAIGSHAVVSGLRLENVFDLDSQ
jgi:hypothetical protein